MTTLTSDEQYWADHQPWLLSLGYQLRPRFQPGWVASWVTHPVSVLEKIKREDYLRLGGNPVMDATRLSDNRHVMLKKIYSRESGLTEEQAISEFVSFPEQIQNPTNHCVRVIETLPIPGDDDNVIIVMPLLRKWTSPRFDTIGESMDMIRQAFKGIQYLHRNRIAHRDCNDANFVMDGSEMYPEGFHVVKQDHNREYTELAIQKYTRTQCPPRYCWIDFGLSVSFDPSDNRPRARPIMGGDKSVPEHRDIYLSLTPQPTDPFATDIYYLGNFLRMRFTEGWADCEYKLKYGFEFLKPLVAAMVQDNPAKRPDIDECVIHLEKIIQSLSSWTLRSQVWHASDNPFGFIYRFFPHWARRVVYIITRTPAIPDRNRPPNPNLPRYTNLLISVWSVTPFLLILRNLWPPYEYITLYTVVISTYILIPMGIDSLWHSGIIMP